MSEVIKQYAEKIEDVCSSTITLFNTYNKVLYEYSKIIMLYALYCIAYCCLTYAVCSKRVFLGTVIVMTIHSLLRITTIGRSLNILKLIVDDVTVPLKEIQKVTPLLHDKKVMSSSFTHTHDLLLTLLVLAGTTLEANTQMERILLEIINERKMCHVYFGALDLLLLGYIALNIFTKGGS